MYTIREITEMRKSGHLKKAYEMAKSLQEDNPGEWADMAMFWVLRDMALELLDEKTLEARTRLEDLLSEMERLQSTMMDEKGLGIGAIKKIKSMMTPHASEMAGYSELSQTDPIIAYNRAISLAGEKGQHVDQRLHEALGWIFYRHLKAKSGCLAPREGALLLWNYLNLKNERPSMLHSIFLGLAISLYHQSGDFSFGGFLQHWGLQNLRQEDMESSYGNNGETYHSLLSRLCTLMSAEDNPMIDDIASVTGRPILDIVDMQRNAWFWTLNNCKKEEGCSERFMQLCMDYAARFGRYDSTHWHLQILSLITRDFEMSQASFLLHFLEATANVRIAASQWSPNRGKDGKMYPSNAIKYAKTCFDALKSIPELQRNPSCITSLRNLYEDMEQNDVGDEWTDRNHAYLSSWAGDLEDSAERFRKLLEILGAAYYAWRELAAVVQDTTIKAGLLLNALELQKDESFVGPVKLDLAEILIHEGYLNDARKYLNEYLAFRKKKGMSIDNRYIGLLVLLDNSIVQPSRDRYDKKKAVTAAMEYVYADHPWEEFLLVAHFESNGKQRIKFLSDKRSFVIPVGRFDISKKIPEGTIVQCRCAVEEVNSSSAMGVRLKPLMMRSTDMPLWSILPIQEGCIVRVNREKGMLIIVTPSGESYVCFDRSTNCKEGDCVTFRYYEDYRKDEKRTVVVDLKLSDQPETILEQFPKGIAAVDNVNTEKSLFHVWIRGSNGRLLDSVIRFSETAIRPKKGDSLSLRYGINRDKRGHLQVQPIEITTTDEVDETLVQSFRGELQLKYRSSDSIDPDYAFVGDIYVPKYLLEKGDYMDEDIVVGRALYSNRGSYQAFELKKEPALASEDFLVFLE